MSEIKEGIIILLALAIDFGLFSLKESGASVCGISVKLRLFFLSISDVNLCYVRTLFYFMIYRLGLMILESKAEM